MATTRRVDVSDHPRGCGEHDVARVIAVPRKGSSPRMRGAHVQALDVALVCGIIPADAGSTCCCHA